MSLSSEKMLLFLAFAALASAQLFVGYPQPAPSYTYPGGDTHAIPDMFIVLQEFPLPQGNIASFEYVAAESTSTRSFTPYVVRQTGINTFTIVYEGSQVTIPANTPNSPPASSTITLATLVPVMTGDFLAYFGNGIQIATAAAGGDLVYNAPDPQAGSPPPCTALPPPPPATGFNPTAGSAPNACTVCQLSSSTTGDSYPCSAAGVRRYAFGATLFFSGNE